MTETEAKTKWCPMVRLVDYGFALDCDHDGDASALIVAAGAPHNRMKIGMGEDEAELAVSLSCLKCIGSDCMMWRETPTVVSDAEIATGEAVMHGYCGLAGKP